MGWGLASSSLTAETLDTGLSLSPALSLPLALFLALLLSLSLFLPFSLNRASREGCARRSRHARPFVGVQGYLAHKKHPPPWDHHRSLCYGGGGSYERGTPVFTSQFWKIVLANPATFRSQVDKKDATAPRTMQKYPPKGPFVDARKNPHASTGIGTSGGPRGGAGSYERGTPVETIPFVSS